MNIFLVDASSDVRLALQMLLDNEPGLNVIGLAVETEGLLARVEASQPDVLLLDWCLIRGSLDDFLAGLQTLVLRPRVILLIINPGEEQSFPDTEVDAVYYKADPPEELLTTLCKMRDEMKQE